MFGGLDSGVGKSAMALVAAIVLAWHVARDTPGRSFWRAVAPVYVLLALAAGWAALASSGVLRDAAHGTALTPDLLTHELIGLGGYACILLIGALTGYRRARLAPLADWLIAFVVVDILIGLLVRQWAEDPMFTFWSRAAPDRFAGTLNNANVAGAVYGGTAALALARLFDRDRTRRDESALAVPLSWGALIGALAAVVLTASRADMVVTVLAMIGVAAIGIRRSRRRRSSLRRVAAVGGVMAMVLTAQISLELMARFDLLGEHSIKRQALWAHFATIAAQSPWLGYGFGSFSVVNGRYLGPPRQAAQWWTVNSPHDFVLHLLLQAGLPYLILIAAAIFIVARAVAKRLVRRDTPPGDIGLVAAAAVLAASSTIDIALEVPAVAAMLLLVAGLSWGRAIAAIIMCRSLSNVSMVDGNCTLKI